MASNYQSETTDSATPNSGWRGPRKKVIRHRWQKDWTQQPLKGLKRLSQWRNLRLAVFFFLFVGLCSSLLYFVLYSPTQTPMLAIGVTQYTDPLDPNAWTQEDIESFGALANSKKRKRSLELVDSSSAWDSKEAGLAELERQIEVLGKSNPRSGTVIIYLSMHGAVNEQGVPCLIPPNRRSPQAALDSANWIPLSTILEKLRSMPKKLNKLLILDCNRMKANWSVGMLNNTFASKIEEAEQKAKISNLAILNSTRDGQVGFSSPDLQGSVFAHYLKLGLAGFADSENGNDDKIVSLSELYDYLKHHVDDWVMYNRAFHQQPKLFTRMEDADFHLAWSLKESDQNALKREAQNRKRGKPHVAVRRLNVEWDKLQSFELHRPLQLDPIAWSQMQQQLLWIEKTNYSGKAYRTLSHATYKKMRATRRHVESILAPKLPIVSKKGDKKADGKQVADKKSSTKKTEQPSVAEYRSTIANNWNLFSQNISELPKELQLHSMVLAEQLGTVSPEKISLLKERLEAVKTVASQANVNAALAAFRSVNKGIRLDDAQFLQMLVYQKNPQIGRTSPAIKRALDLRQRAAVLAVPIDMRVLPWIKSQLAAANQKRMAAEDYLLSGSNELLSEANQEWNEAEKLYDQAQQITDQITAAMATRDLAFSKLPYYARWIGRPLPPEAGPTKTKLLDDRVNKTLKATQAAHQLDALLQQHPTATSDINGMLKQISTQSEDVQSSLTTMQSWITQDADTFLALRAKGKKGLGPKVAYDIDSMLAGTITTKIQRDDLRRLMGQIEEGMYGGYKYYPVGSPTRKKKVEKESKKSDGVILPPISYEQRILTHWTQSTKHPALAILKPESQPRDLSPDDKSKQQEDGHEPTCLEAE